MSDLLSRVGVVMWLEVLDQNHPNALHVNTTDDDWHRLGSSLNR